MPDGIGEAVISRAQGGDAAAIGAVYEHYHLSVLRYLYYRVGDHQAAEDLTSEVFLRMIKALPRYRQRSTSFQAWLFRIARNLAVDHFRKLKVRQHSDLEEHLVAGEEAPETAVERSLTGERLRQAMTKLLDDQREVIALRFVAGMPIAQVSQTLGKSEAAVKGLQRRALMALRDILADWEVEYVSHR
jgi:RNA polymerase sigma-70 factor (ECF subfamily)